MVIAAVGSSTAASAPNGIFIFSVEGLLWYGRSFNMMLIKIEYPIPISISHGVAEIENAVMTAVMISGPAITPSSPPIIQMLMPLPTFFPEKLLTRGGKVACNVAEEIPAINRKMRAALNDEAMPTRLMKIAVTAGANNAYFLRFIRSPIWPMTGCRMEVP